MKGFLLPYCYMGYLDGEYQPFATEGEYLEEVKEREGILHEQNVEKCGTRKV